MRVEAYTIEPPVKGLCKQWSVAGLAGSTFATLMYIQRPKWITDDGIWETIVRSIRLELPQGMEVK